MLPRSKSHAPEPKAATQHQSPLWRLKLWVLFLCWLAGLVSLQAQTNSVVTVNADKVLTINGRKAFTIGFSPGPPTNGKTPTGKDALQELRDAGALLFRISQTGNWDSQLITNQQAALDWAYEHGMYVWLNLRELSKFPAGDTATEASLRSVVDTFRNHPALGLWKNYDEAWWGNVPVADLQRGYDVIKQEDTNHPIVQTHAPRGTVQDLQPYNAAADILALDIYPVGYPPGANSLETNKEISMVGDFTKFLSQVGNNQKQYWMIEQIAWSGATPPAKTLRFPTFAQERFMAYQAIINGARGLMFFGGNVAATLNPQDAALGWNWTFWDEVLKRVVQQLGDNSLLADALVAPPANFPITLSGTAAPDIEFCVREAPPYLYILACKREGATVQATFNGLPASAGLGEVLYESPRTVTATNGQFSDWFGPFEVHAYRFYISNQSPAIISQPQSRTNYSGTIATFSVAATGTPPLSYQWRKNGSNLSNGGNISGATSSLLSLANVSQPDAAAYDVIVTGYGSLTSAPPAILAIVNNSNQAPNITGQPQSRTNVAGTTATFSVSATANGPLTYQWRRSSTNLADGGNISGASSATLTLANVGQSDAASYDVIVTAVGSITSALASLTVIYPTNQLILYEPFDYSNIGTQVSLNNPANWTFNGSGANDLNVTAGSLLYPGLAFSIGNSVTNGGVGLGTRRLFGSSIDGGVLYFSALFRINDLGIGVWNGASSQVGALTAIDNTNFRLAVLVKANSAASYLIGLQKGGTGASSTFDATEHYAGETVFLVGKYDFTVSPNIVFLWIDPELSTFGASEPTNGLLEASTGLDGYIIDRFNMRQNTATSVPAAMQWDELRFGRSWADVTPPASTATTLQEPVKLPNGSFRFSFTNNTGLSSSVYASSNLVDWQAVGGATQVGPGYYQYIDATATNFPRRFFKLR